MLFASNGRPYDTALKETSIMRHRKALLAILLAAVVAMSVPAWAIIVIDSKTGLFGVTGGQTIRVSVLNAGDKGAILPCTKVFDMSGNLLAEAEGMPVRPGQGTFVDFNAAALGVRVGQRLQVRAEVELLPPPEDNLPPPDDGQPPDPAQPPDPLRVRAGNVILTLEVFNTATGETAFTMPWVTKGFNPQPEPPARERAR
jgi:hypothetical protein